MPVVKIVRLRIGTLKLGNLKPRQWPHLTENEVLDLKGEKGRMVENQRVRDNRRHPTDRSKCVIFAKPPKLAPNERPSTPDRLKRTPSGQPRKTNRNDHSRGATKPRTPRR